MRKNARFMSNTFLDRGFSYSSQYSTSFPASNAYDTSRSKVWKTGGNFEITSTNNKLYINDGSDKTVTLTAASYTYSTLAAHVQTQLNASSSNWTCTYSTTTHKFTIARSSGTAVLRETQTTNAVWDTLGYNQGADITGTPFVADESRIHTSEWLKCDCGVPQTATFACLLGSIDEEFSLTQNAVVTLQASNLDSWTSPAVSVDLPVESLSAMAFLDDSFSTPYRYYRIKIVDRLNPLGPEGISIGYAYIGDHVTMTNTNIAVGFSKILQDPSIVQSSENGALFFEVRPRYREISSAEIQYLSGTEYDELEQFFYDVGIRTPFLVSIDPGVEVSRKLEDMTHMMIMSRPPELAHILRDMYNVSFDMREAF